MLPVTGLIALVVAGAGAVVMAEDSPLQGPKADTDIIAAALETQPQRVSRNADRPPLPDAEAAEAKVEGEQYALNDLDIHADAAKSSPVLATVAQGDTVAITGKTKKIWTQIIHNDLPRWVLTDEIAAEMPLGTGPCASGSSVERGLQPDTVRVHRAVCAAFPEITRYGGLAGRGEHATGHSLDIMVSSDLGNSIAAYLQQHRAELGIEYLIWRQRIWRPATSAAWRGMSSRGSATANHMDHVHVTTYGSAGTG